MAHVDGIWADCAAAVRHAIMHHLLIDHDFRVAHAVQHSGQAGGRTMKYNQPPPGLREAGFPINKFCCVEMTLVREHD